MAKDITIMIRPDATRAITGFDMIIARLWIQYARAYWREPLLELEPPRRPPSWYPGRPEPQKPRKRACTCMYVVTQVSGAPGPYVPVPPPSGEGDLTWGTRCFVIVFDCPHHGDDLLDIETELDDLYPDGGVWGFTIEDC